MPGAVTVHVLVSGRVQGVSYRAFTRATAAERSVAGWVRNLADGRVEAMLCGQRDAVEATIARLANGPPAARVDDLECEERPWQPLAGFEIR